MDLEFHGVNKDRWSDFERLFECKGGPHSCWCMVWRSNEYEKTLPGKKGKKRAIKRRVDAGVPIGILAYTGDTAIAWCSIAPRESYRALGGDDSISHVWSLTCFFIKREYRGKGLSGRLVAAAIDYAKKHGAGYVEAYPVARDSPSYRFMGFKPLFEDAGFRFVKMAGTRRNVMVYTL